MDQSFFIMRHEKNSIIFIQYVHLNLIYRHLQNKFLVLFCLCYSIYNIKLYLNEIIGDGVLNKFWVGYNTFMKSRLEIITHLGKTLTTFNRQPKTAILFLLLVHAILVHPHKISYMKHQTKTKKFGNPFRTLDHG